MSLASKILFETPFNGKPLYKKQLDLVYDLLSDPGSEYYINPEEEVPYSRQLIRLKTLISQLLSPHVCRNIPSEFPIALKSVISKKIGDPIGAEQTVQEIIDDLRLKNDLSSKNDNKHQSMMERLKADFKIGSYIAIISSHPLEIESDEFSENFSIRHLFVQDLISNINDEEFIPKKYRLLFPLDSSCFLFWKGLKELLARYIKKNKTNKKLIHNLKTRFGTVSFAQPDLFDQEESALTEKDVSHLATGLISFLNSEGFISVFWHTTPLFSLPVIAINPAESKNAKVYTIMRNDKDVTHIHKYANEETMLWRFFVWDRIKTKQFAGKRIDFDVNNLADY